MAMPYFGNDTVWNYRTFRRLCQDTRGDGTLTPIYDCSEVDRWNEYTNWRDELCCSNDPEFDGISACNYTKCSDDPTVDKIIRDTFMKKFTIEYGFTPPTEQPFGIFLMD
eukprot:12801776-Ditylum_brightwellii.AAC.1